MKFNLPIIGVMVLQGGFLFAYVNRGFDQYHRFQYYYPYGRFSSDVLQVNISWTVVFLLAILVPVVLFLSFVFIRATKKRIALLFILVLAVEIGFALISPFVVYEGVGKPDWALADWMFVGLVYGLPIAGLSLISTALMSWKFYKRSQLVNSL